MNDTERLAVLVQHPSEALEPVAHAMRGQLGSANEDRILDAAYGAGVIVANTEDRR